MCCGQMAKQRMIPTVKHGPLYPDICDRCWTISSELSNDELYFDLVKKQKEFESTFEVVGFRPIIRRK